MCTTDPCTDAECCYGEQWMLRIHRRCLSYASRCPCLSWWFRVGRLDCEASPSLCGFGILSFTPVSPCFWWRKVSERHSPFDTVLEYDCDTQP